MAPQRVPANVVRLTIVAAGFEVTAGLGAFILGSRFATAMPFLNRALVSAAMNAGGILLLLSVRYPLPASPSGWLRAVAVLPLAYEASIMAAVGLWPPAMLQAALVAAIVALVIDPALGSSAEDPDPVAAIVALGEAASGVLILAAPKMLSRTVYAPVAGILPGIAAAGLLGAAAMALPNDRGRWLQPRPLRRLIGAAMPVALASTAPWPGTPRGSWPG